MLAILRRRDLRVIVLAVVLGEAIAHGARSVIIVLAQAVPLAVVNSGHIQHGAWSEFVQMTLTNAVVSIGLWAAVAIVTLGLLRRILAVIPAGKADERADV
jgi:hypothetical protein